MQRKWRNSRARWRSFVALLVVALSGAALVETAVAVAPVLVTPPAIQGTPQDGQTLTATQGDWTSAGAISYTYQWRRCTGPDPVADCTDIPGTDASDDNDYTVQHADVGKVLRVVETATNADGPATANSAPTTTVTAAPPTNATAPVISGTAQDGSVLSTTDGSWDGTPPISFSYRWRRCTGPDEVTDCVDIAGADASDDADYRLKPADVGKTIRVVVTAMNTAGSASKGSASTATVAALPPSNSAPPTITGTARDGQILTATDGTWDGTPPLTFDYQWRRCTGPDPVLDCANIAGAVEQDYELKPADVGKTIRVVVTATNSVDSASQPSAQRGPVTAAPPVNVNPPSISGNPKRGTTLTANDGSWAGTPPITFTRRWRRCTSTLEADCVNIAGATGTTYVPTTADVGNRIRVVVKADNPHPSSQPEATSAPTAVVTDGPTASFTISPTSPLSNETVTLTSTSTPPVGGSIVSYLWDLDDDGVHDDGSGAVLTPKFATPGNHEIRLRVEDNNGNASVGFGKVVVRNRPPVAAFTWQTSPRVGDQVSFISLATDPDSPLALLAWDLDGNGNFNDDTGRVATRTFSRPGVYRVGLRARDDRGATATLVRSVTVGAAVLPLISPFPIVRIVGKLTRRGARVKLLSVRAPEGSVVTIRCRGSRCPYRRRSRVVGSTGVRRIRSLARNLRAGTRISVVVSRSGRIGKHTLFRIRRGRSPARTDRCMVPGASGPSPCPTD